LFRVGLSARPAQTTFGFKNLNHAESSILSLRDPVLRSLPFVEFPHSPLERKLAFRRIRMGPLVSQDLCYRSPVSAGLVSLSHFPRNSISLLRLGISQAV